MCGIAGVWPKDGNMLNGQIKNILDAQQHRGPDNKQATVVDDLALGHNRLSIIDLDKRSNQPFVSNCGRYSIVYNGEIYNFKELKKNLKYNFRTESDTEVLLAMYIEYGEDCLEKLNGMFAFAIYDNKSKILFCARDRIGQKPFVYAQDDSGFYFASELNALFSLGIFDDEEDEIGIAYSFLRNFRHIPEPYTKYKAIRRLEPAHAMLIKDKKIIKKWCYWSPSLDYDKNLNQEDLKNIIDDAVKLREYADVEVATLLSGGVDSSIITGLMVEHGLKPKAYTLKADDEELSRAKLVAKQFGIDLKVFEYDKKLQANLYQKMIDIYGEEVRLLPLTHAARLYQKINEDGIKVVLSGVGADEIFYGYNGANQQLLFSDMVKMLEFLPKKFLTVLEKICSRQEKLKLLFNLAQIENKKRKGHLYQQEATAKGYDNFDYATLLDFWADKVETKNYIDVSNWLGLITENAHSITISSDLPSMMYGIETRAPFLDYRVIEMAFKIDAHRKVAKRNGRANNKLILKQSFEYLLPDDILYASKKGFGYGIK